MVKSTSMTSEILVFGRSGQLAAELATRLPGATFLARADVDVSDLDAVDAAIRSQNPSAVLNATAYTAVDDAEDKPETANQINGKAPGVMARACSDLNIPFLHVSTDYVFDGSGSDPWREDMVTKPVNAYGASKLAGEAEVAQAGGKYAILRTAWVFSSHGTNFVKTMLKLTETHSELSIVDDQFGGPTWAGDIADALIAMLSKLEQSADKSGVYHFSGQPFVSWAGFAEEIFAQSKRSINVSKVTSAEFQRPAARPSNSRMDCQKIASVFGVEPPDWRIGLRNVINELKVGQNET